MEINSTESEMDIEMDMFLNTSVSYNDTLGNRTGYTYILDTFVYDVIMVPVIWGLLVIAGVLGNGLVAYVMCRYGDLNTTNCYIVNLATTDLLFTIVVIPWTMMHYVMPYWIFGKFLCKFHQYMIYVCLHATCLTLTAMSIDRYFAIVHPIKSIVHRTPKVAIGVSVSIWIVSLLVCVPFGYYTDLWRNPRRGPDFALCRDKWPNADMGLYILVVTYVIPLLVIMFCYTRILRRIWKNKSMVRPASTTQQEGGAIGTGSHQVALSGSRLQGHKRRKAAKMVGVVILLFALCWLPIHIFLLCFRYDRNFPRTQATYICKILAHALSYANSCVNPIVYCFLGDGFRKAAKKAFPWILGGNGGNLAHTSTVASLRRANDGGTASTAMTLGASDLESEVKVTGQRQRVGSPRQDHIVLSRQMSLPSSSGGNRIRVLSMVEELSL